MWSDITKSLLEFLKLAPRYLVAASAVCALMLFLPKELLDTLGLAPFVESYRQWIGLALVCTFGILVASFGSTCIAWLVGNWRVSRFRKQIAARLENLTEPEKQILRYYLAKNTRGNSLRLENGDVQALTQAGIIYRSAPVGSLLDGFAHNISDFAWEYLHAHPHLLSGTTNTYHTDKSDKWWE